MTPSNSNGGPEAASGQGNVKACEVALTALAEYDGIDLRSPDFRLYDHVDPDALNDLFTHQPGTIDSIVLEIDGATLEIWESEGLYARVLEKKKTRSDTHQPSLMGFVYVALAISARSEEDFRGLLPCTVFYFGALVTSLR
jgi:Halobacterial output domain 1